MKQISSGRAGGFTVAGPSKGPFRNRPWCNRVPLHRRERCAPKRRRTYSRKYQTLTATPAEPGVLPGAIAGIKQMNRRRQLTIRQGLVDWYGHSVVGNRCRGGFDVNDEMRGIIGACLRQMNLVPGPTRLALLAIVSIDIIG